MAKRASRSHVDPFDFGNNLLYLAIDNGGVSILDQGVIFRYRHSGERGLVDWILPHRNRGYFEYRRLLRFAVTTGILAVRAVRNAFAGNGDAFNNDLGGRRHLDVDGFTFRQLDRATAQTSGNMEFIDPERHLRLGTHNNRRFHSDCGRYLQSFLSFLRHQNHAPEMME